MRRVIEMGGMYYVQTCIDASYAMHRVMGGHTGGIISMGKGTLIHKCSKDADFIEEYVKKLVVTQSRMLIS